MGSNGKARYKGNGRYSEGSAGRQADPWPKAGTGTTGLCRLKWHV